MSAHHHERLFIPGPAGKLQALYQPGEVAAVVVCHPHPQFGGTMRNKVVYWMARAFEDIGCAVVRFNFRGVEQSEGVFDEGRGEAEDAGAVLDWLSERHPGQPLWLAGFSFGCYAGLQAARNNARVARMFAVAPAVNHWSFEFMAGDTRPLTVVQGRADEIVPFAQVAAWVEGLAQADFHALADAGHFFPEHMQTMARCLVSGVSADRS
jgi:uncharacterized protein